MDEKKIQIQSEVKIDGRDQLLFKAEISESGELCQPSLSGVGGPALLKLLEDWRPKLVGKVADLPLPEQRDSSSLLLRELILRAQGLWVFPYDDETICYCRQISTQAVDQAIIFGAHTHEKVSEQTSASTACGTCREDVEKLLRYRLDKK